MNKINYEFISNIFLYIRTYLSNPASEHRLKHNKSGNDSKQYAGQKQLEVVSNFKYFRSWCRANSATF
jgi:hypothetical protein